MAAFALCDAARMEREAGAAQAENDHDRGDQDKANLDYLHCFPPKIFLEFSFRQTGRPVSQDPCLCVPTLRWVYSFRRIKRADCLSALQLACFLLLTSHTKLTTRLL